MAGQVEIAFQNATDFHWFFPRNTAAERDLDAPQAPASFPFSRLLRKHAAIFIGARPEF
jgi:hypothetical protein